MTLTWIVLAGIAGGLLSVCAASFALVLRASWVPMLVSFAIGTLLGAAFLEVVPQAFEAGNAHRAAAAPACSSWSATRCTTSSTAC